MAYDEKFFAEATAAQLKEFRKTVNLEDADPMQVVALDELIMERMVDERVNGSLAQQRQKEQAKKLDQKAYQMWPELKDEKSDFYKAVNEYMEQHGADGAESLLHSANAVGLDLGLQPAGRTPGKGGDKSGKIKGGENYKEDTKPDDAFFKKTEKIAKAFGNMIDLSDEKVRERIAARVEEDAS